MSTDAWVAIVSGLSGAVVGGWGLFEARKARAEARQANRHAAEANQIAVRALESSEQIGRDQIELHRREFDLAHKAEQSRGRANIQVYPAMKTSHGVFKLRLENRGPHHADRVTVSLHRAGESLEIDQLKNLAPDRAVEVTGNRGSFLAGAVASEVDDVTRAGAETIELQVTFTDGNGPQLLRKLLTIGPGSRFVDRQWTIEDWLADD